MNSTCFPSFALQIFTSCLSCAGIVDVDAPCIMPWSHTHLAAFMSRRPVSRYRANCVNMYRVNKYRANTYHVNKHCANMYCANMYCVLLQRRNAQPQQDPDVSFRSIGLLIGTAARQVPRLTSCGSQAGDQCLLKGVIFLFGLSQFRIGYGWASMAHIWNSTHLRKPLSTAQPSIHPLSALLVLILGRLQFASSSPPISLRLQFRLPPYSITDFFPTVKPYFWNTFLHVNHTVDQ